jgi:ribosomal protein S18 acetylase RimI-like enzyme
MDRCAECGFVYELDEAEEAGHSIVAGSLDFCSLLRRIDAGVATRRNAELWSPLEYGCHLRDVLLAQRERVLLARRSDHPSAQPMGRDERVEHDGYADQHPEDVARQLGDAACMLGNVLDRLDAAGWDRTIVYNYPVRTDRTLRWLAIHTLHEVRHHLKDARRQLGSRVVRAADGHEVTYRTDKEIDVGAWLRLYNSCGWNRDWTSHNAEVMLAHAFLIITAWRGDEIVGTLTVLGDGLNYATIDDVVVHPDHRGHGIGTHLVRLAIERAGHLDIHLNAIPGVAAYYEKLGFVAERGTTGMYRPPATRI